MTQRIGIALIFDKDFSCVTLDLTRLTQPTSWWNCLNWLVTGLGLSSTDFTLDVNSSHLTRHLTWFCTQTTAHDSGLPWLTRPLLWLTLGLTRLGIWCGTCHWTWTWLFRHWTIFRLNLDLSNLTQHLAWFWFQPTLHYSNMSRLTWDSWILSHLK